MLYFAIFLLSCQILAGAEQHSTITLIHDDSIDLPKKSMEAWTQVIVENWIFQCPTPISANIIYLDPKIDLNKELTQMNFDEKLTNAFVIITNCELAVALIHRIRTFKHNPNIIFFDFFFCQPIQRSEAFHIELFHVKIDIRPACVQLAAHKWVEYTVCSSGIDENTNKLLNLTFSLDVVNECSHDYIHSFDVYLNNNEAEENYIHHFLNGKKLHVATVEEKPLVTVATSPVNGSIVKYRGICFDIFNILQQHFNFTYDVLIPEDGSYGIGMANGTWDGIIGMVTNKVADIGVHSLSVTHERYQVVDFIPFDVDPKDILVSASIENVFACARPFSKYVWLVLLLVLFSIPFILTIFERICQRMQPKFYATPLIDFYLYIYRVLLNQSNGQKIACRNIAMCLLMTIWSFCAIVISNAYTGKIVSNLLAPQQSLAINSLEELAYSSLSWVIRRGTSLESRFMEAQETDKIDWQIGERFRKNPELMIEAGPTRFDKIRKYVASGEYAYIGAISSIERIMEEDYAKTKHCRMRIVKDKIFHSNKAFVLRKGSPLTNIFNKQMSRIMESGLGDYWHKRNYPEFSVKNICQNVRSSKGETKLTFYSLRSAFQILTLGIGLAIGAFILEILCYFRQLLNRRT